MSTSIDVRVWSEQSTCEMQEQYSPCTAHRNVAGDKVHIVIDTQRRSGGMDMAPSTDAAVSMPNIH